jgi:REP-associated tyrosine transposase
LLQEIDQLSFLLNMKRELQQNRRSIRLRDYDYTQEGAYFVTICTQDRAPALGRIVAGEVLLNEIGHIVAESWRWLEQQHRYIELDQWVVMPNHLHGIILIKDGAGGSRTAPTSARRKPLGRLIGSFKTVSTKRINETLSTPGVAFWQRNYYEHVIRSEKALNAIREYIEANPGQWYADPDNPDAIGSGKTSR